MPRRRGRLTGVEPRRGVVGLFTRFANGPLGTGIDTGMPTARIPAAPPKAAPNPGR